MDKSSTLLLGIAGMHCVSCAMNIDFELEDLPGVTESRTDYIKQKLEVKFNPQKTKKHEIFSVIDRLGYKVISEDEKD